MEQAEFEALLFINVADRAAKEPASPTGKPKYYGRPWLQLRDEMVAGDALTVADLPPRRITAFYRSTGSSQEDATGIFQRLSGSAQSNGAAHRRRSR
jgi:hypothetical protein